MAQAILAQAILAQVILAQAIVFKPFVLHPCVCSLFVLGFMAPQTSCGKARRLREAAVKRKLWMRGGHGDGVDGRVVESQDVCLSMVQIILTMNGFFLQWLQSYSTMHFSVPVPAFSSSRLLATVPAEPGPCKADDEKNDGENGVHGIDLIDPIKIEKDSLSMRIAAEAFPCKKNVDDDDPNLILNL